MISDRMAKVLSLLQARDDPGGVADVTVAAAASALGMDGLAVSLVTEGDLTELLWCLTALVGDLRRGDAGGVGVFEEFLSQQAGGSELVRAVEEQMGFEPVHGVGARAQQRGPAGARTADGAGPPPGSRHC